MLIRSAIGQSRRQFFLFLGSGSNKYKDILNDISMVKKLTDGIAVGGDMDLVEHCLN